MSRRRRTRSAARVRRAARAVRARRLSRDRRVAPDETLDAIVAELDGLFGKPPYEEGGVRYFRNRIQDAWRINEHVKALALSPAVLALLEDLYGRRPLPFQTINFLRGTQQAPHSDAIHFSTMPEGSCAACGSRSRTWTWTTARSSTTRARHKLPYVTAGRLRRRGEVGELSELRALRRRPDRARGPRAALRHDQEGPGDHLGGQPPPRRRDPERPRATRLSQVTHYFFEGCRYYTPMSSEGEDVRWRDPVWVA